jgi:hypothetical protein
VGTSWSNFRCRLVTLSAEVSDGVRCSRKWYRHVCYNLRTSPIQTGYPFFNDIVDFKPPCGVCLETYVAHFVGLFHSETYDFTPPEHQFSLISGIKNLIDFENDFISRFSFPNLVFAKFVPSILLSPHYCENHVN